MSVYPTCMVVSFIPMIIASSAVVEGIRPSNETVYIELGTIRFIYKVKSMCRWITFEFWEEVKMTGAVERLECLVHVKV